MANVGVRIAVLVTAVTIFSGLTKTAHTLSCGALSARKPGKAPLRHDDLGVQYELVP